MAVLSRVYVEAEGAAGEWLKATARITDLVAQRVFYKVPSGAQFPFLVVQRVGGAPEMGDVPVDAVRIQVDCWGANKRQAATVAAAVVTAAESMVNGTPMGDAAVGCEALCVLGPLYRQEPSSARDRYVVDLLIRMVAVDQNTTA